MDMDKLDALGGLVEEVDGASPQAQAEAQAVVQQQADAEQGAREWGVIAYTVGSALGMLAPELRQVYTEDACLNWGRAMVPVADKYGWNGPANVPEIGLLLATAGLAVPSVIAVRARLAELKKAREAKAETITPSGPTSAAEFDPDHPGGATDGG